MLWLLTASPALRLAAPLAAPAVRLAPSAARLAAPVMQYRNDVVSRMGLGTRGARNGGDYDFYDRISTSGGYASSYDLDYDAYDRDYYRDYDAYDRDYDYDYDDYYRYPSTRGWGGAGDRYTRGAWGRYREGYSTDGLYDSRRRRDVMSRLGLGAGGAYERGGYDYGGQYREGSRWGGGYGWGGYRDGYGGRYSRGYGSYGSWGQGWDGRGRDTVARLGLGFRGARERGGYRDPATGWWLSRGRGSFHSRGRGNYGYGRGNYGYGYGRSWWD